MMKHKHSEILIAIANGETVEFYNFDRWIIATPNDSITNPITHDHLEWRIKKEPVITVKYFRLESHPLLGLRYESFTPDLEEWNLKVTYEDDIAIKAELPTKA